MDRLEKFKGLSIKKADARADIALINQFAVKELTPEEVYCFSVVLCDNDVDRDLERFTDKTLNKLAELFVGKTGISDHCWSADRQFARLYRTEVKATTEKNALNEPLKQLVGSAYMIRNEANQPIIDAIDGGILKEVSIGCAISKRVCNICGKPLDLDRRTWTYQCETGHIKGETYNGKLCVGNLEDPIDAYEFSLVAVPAQRGAGITKSVENVHEAITLLLGAEAEAINKEPDIRELAKKLHFASLEADERAQRAEIAKAVSKYRTN